MQQRDRIKSKTPYVNKFRQYVTQIRDLLNEKIKKHSQILTLDKNLA